MESKYRKGDRWVQYWVVAQTKTGTADLLRFNSNINGVSGDPERMGSLVTSFNSFLLSNQATWNYVYYDQGYVAILPIAFISIFLLGGIFSFWSNLAPKPKELLIFNKQQRRIFWQRPQDNYKEEQPLHKLQAIEVHEAKIAGTRQVFQVYALLEDRGLIIIEEACNRTYAEKLSKELSKFLAVPIYNRQV